MNKSVWYIFTFGMMGALMLSMFMCITLDQFQQSPASQSTKLAQAIRRQFGLTAAGTVVRNEGAKKVLRIIYQTTRDSKFDSDVQNAEMEEIARYAFKTHKSRRKGEIEAIRVTRHEMRGSGCWRRTYTSSFELDPPSESTVPDFMRRIREAEPFER